MRQSLFIVMAMLLAGCAISPRTRHTNATTEPSEQIVLSLFDDYDIIVMFVAIEDLLEKHNIPFSTEFSHGMMEGLVSKHDVERAMQIIRAAVTSGDLKVSTRLFSWWEEGAQQNKD